MNKFKAVSFSIECSSCTGIKLVVVVVVVVVVVAVAAAAAAVAVVVVVAVVAAAAAADIIVIVAVAVVVIYRIQQLGHHNIVTGHTHKSRHDKINVSRVV